MRSDGTDQINKISEVPCRDVEREKWLLFLGRYTERARITSVCFVSGLRGSFRARTSAQSAGRDASRQAAIRKERRRTTSELKAAENKEREVIESLAFGRLARPQCPTLILTEEPIEQEIGHRSLDTTRFLCDRTPIYNRCAMCRVFKTRDT